MSITLPRTIRDLRDDVARGSRVALRGGVSVEVLSIIGNGESTSREGEDHSGGAHSCEVLMMWLRYVIRGSMEDCRDTGFFGARNVV